MFPDSELDCRLESQSLFLGSVVTLRGTGEGEILHGLAERFEASQNIRSLPLLIRHLGMIELDIRQERVQ